MSINVDLLKRICEVAGAPGFEKRVREMVIEEVKNHVDEWRVDNMGNVITVKKGKNNPEGKKAMVAAHMDEIGFIVTHIDDNGFVRFHTLGGFDPKTLTAQRVIIHGRKDVVGVMGSKPIHVMSQEERGKVAKTSDYFIDLGMKKEEVEKWVAIGDPITRERELIEMGNCVNCKSIDNRVSVFILIEALKQLQNHPYDVYGVFTVQEEVGLRGANVSAHTINPDFGFGLDTTIAYDLPGAQPHEMVTKLGEGVAIKIMDASTICDYRMVDFMKKTATSAQIKWQPEVLTAGGTDTAGVQRMGKEGAISGAISIPTRHLHQVIEMADKDDIQGAIDLLIACLEGLDGYDWSH
ncbi:MULTISPECIES: M42 family metallopeptidase [Roseivirga]|uniref:Peptidase M42 n=1 Tax=Roseivirga thermotolerans TaxID=1758176 RepID=A0ABQ3I8U2_9BACT|nr:MULTISPECIES: M42 family metallopeptidase [Roseivirga]MEC7754661.1 M42 family metallopeptidase [Bacteroidota bacterium]GHE74387.1 peptidase M42 [Roseivirga thermotolerans]|tara:strand:+ start:5827 stop:6879 length:1053 start_codon:yes stop_codon:yes gene_type:complete